MSQHSHREYLPSQDRKEIMQRGAEEFLLWIDDLFRQGILSLEKNPTSLERIAQRMVDFKNGSIARRLRMMREQIESDPDWPYALLDEFAELYLLSKALLNDDLDPSHQLDAFQAAGYTIRKDHLPEPKVYAARVMDVQFESYERLRARKVYLAIDESPWYALVLDFAYGRSGFEDFWEDNEWYEVEASMYPSAWPIRMKVFERRGIEVGENIFLYSCEDWTEAVRFTWKRMGAHPWQDEWPFVINSLQLAKGEEDNWLLLDRKGATPEGLILEKGDKKLWELLAFSAGEPFELFCVSINGRIKIVKVRRTQQQWSPLSP